MILPPFYLSFLCVIPPLFKKFWTSYLNITYHSITHEYVWWIFTKWTCPDGLSSEGVTEQQDSKTSPSDYPHLPQSSPLPWLPTNIIFALFVPCISGIIQNIPFCAWILCLNILPVLFKPILNLARVSENGHRASLHPSKDDGEELVAQIYGGITIHNKAQDKKFLWPGPSGLLLGNGWFPLKAIMQEGQHLPCAILLIFQGEWSLELLSIPRRAINLLLAGFNCRMKWPVFLAIFIFPSQSLALWFSGSQAHSFLPSFLSQMLFPFGRHISAESSPPLDPGALASLGLGKYKSYKGLCRLVDWPCPSFFWTLKKIEIWFTYSKVYKS